MASGIFIQSLLARDCASDGEGAQKSNFRKMTLVNMHELSNIHRDFNFVKVTMAFCVAFFHLTRRKNTLNNQ